MRQSIKTDPSTLSAWIVLKLWLNVYFSIQFNTFILPGYHINNITLIYNVVETMDDETNNILYTTRHVVHDKNYEEV